MCEKVLSDLLNSFVASADEHSYLNDHKATDLCGTTVLFLVCDGWFAGEPIPVLDNNNVTYICNIYLKHSTKKLTSLATYHNAFCLSTQLKQMSQGEARGYSPKEQFSAS